MSGERPVPDEDLHAYVDNLLGPDRRAVVARFLQENPEAAGRVAAYAAQRDGLRAALADQTEMPIPPQLSLRILMQQRSDRRRSGWKMAAAIVFALGVGGSGGWLLHGILAPPPGTVALLVREAIANHIVYTADRRRPIELGADQREDLARWVSNRLKMPVAPPDLAANGFRYMGGRLAATSEGPAGMFMYQNEQGVRLTVFVRPVPNAASVSLRHVESGNLAVCAWITKGVGYTVMSDLPAGDLQRIATQVQRQVDGAI